MTTAFISDIHGSRGSLEKTLEILGRHRWDFLVILGDALYHGPRNAIPADYDPAGTADLLNTLKDRVIAVRGNCDSEVDQMLISYPMMGEYAMAIIDSRRFFLTHGHIHTPQNPPSLSPGDIFTFGHTHLPVAEKRDGLFFFNPGSIAIPKGGNPPSYGILDGDTLQVYSLDGRALASCRLD